MAERGDKKMDVSLILMVIGFILILAGVVTIVIKYKKDWAKAVFVVTIVLGAVLLFIGYAVPLTAGGTVQTNTGGGTTTGGGNVIVNAQTPTAYVSVTDDLAGAYLSGSDLNVIQKRMNASGQLEYVTTGTLATAYNVGGNGVQNEFTIVNPVVGTVTYYPKVISFTSDGSAGQSASTTIQKVGTVSVLVKNNDNSTINSGTFATAQALTSGDIKKFYITVSGATNFKYFGDKAQALTLDYNVDGYTSLILQDTQGNTLPTISTGAKTQNTTNNLGVHSWLLDGTLKNAQEKQLILFVTVSSAQQPTTADSNIGYRVSDQCLFKNTDTGVYNEYFTDPVIAGTVICGTDTTGTISVS